MPFTNPQDLKAMDMKALAKELAQTRKYRASLKFENKQGSLKDPSQIKKAQIHIARISTAMSSLLLPSS